MATQRPADPGLGLGARTEHPWLQGTGAGSPSLPGECVRAWVPVLCCPEGLAPEFSGEVEERCPCSLLPRQAPRGLIQPLHLLLEPVLFQEASGDADTPVPMCMYPSLLCQMSLGKAAPGLGACPPSPGLQVWPSPALGNTWLAGRMLAGLVTSMASLGSLL